MSTIRESIRNKIVDPAIHYGGLLTTAAIVTGTDENRNTCDIRYVDKNGITRNRNSVPVRLYGTGTDWFPAAGDHVIVEDSGTTCAIIARNVENYAMDVLAKMLLKQDIYSDCSACMGAGGVIQ